MRSPLGAGFEETTSCAGKAHVAKSGGRPLANGLLGTEVLSPTSPRELKAVNSHMSEEADPSPVKFQMRLKPWLSPSLHPYKGPNF